MKNIKYKILVIIFFSFINIVKSQDYERIKNQNIVFIHYEQLDKDMSKKMFLTNVTNPEKKPCLYKFYYSNRTYKEERLKSQPGSFELYFKIYNFQSKKKELSVFRVHKKFLRKNKDIIINMEFIKKIGLKNTINLLRNAKTILIIDDTHEIKDKTILIKEVVFFDTGPI